MNIFNQTEIQKYKYKSNALEPRPYELHVKKIDKSIYQSNNLLVYKIETK